MPRLAKRGLGNLHSPRAGTVNKWSIHNSGTGVLNLKTWIDKYICFSLSDLLHSVSQALGSSASVNWLKFVPFNGWVIFHYLYVLQLLIYIYGI